jgi:prophage regulatory protein
MTHKNPVENNFLHDKLLRLPEVLKFFPISKSAWYQGIAEGKYPKSIQLGARTVAWKLSDIQKLIEDLTTEGDHAD